MSQKARKEVLVRLRRFYVKAGPKYKQQLLDQAVQLLGYHRKAAIRALRAKAPPVRAVALITGRPKEYCPERLLPILKPIWFGAWQPCGSRLHALLPEWLPAYEVDHGRIDADLRRSLLSASARTLDRLVSPLRSKAGRRGGTRPGSLLRESIPIRGTWEEEGPGWLEVDTGLCAEGGWMICICGCWMRWTFARTGRSSGPWKTAVNIALWSR